MHGMRVNTKRTKGPVAGQAELASTEIWKELVYNKDIDNKKVNEVYGVWAEAYDKDMSVVHANSMF